MSGCDCEVEIKNKEQSRVLIILLGINAFMFLVEITFGILSESTALIADSLDMLADATVYGIRLYAVGRPLLAKIRAAHISGVFQIILGASVSVDVFRRLVWRDLLYEFAWCQRVVSGLHYTRSVRLALLYYLDNRIGCVPRAK